MTKRRKEPVEQQTLPDMPKKGPLYELGVKYLDKRDSLEEAKNITDALKKELIQMLIKKGISSLKIQGVILTWSHKEADTITVRQSE